MPFYKLILLFPIILLFAFKTTPPETEKNKAPKNIILLIGDGAGLSQISSAFFFKDSVPNYQRFKHIGLIKTSSSREKITDSGAGGTAFACGVKSFNGAIGVNDDSSAAKNLVEILSANNWKNGIISTSSVTHATPASFYAHVINRSMEEEIALDFMRSNVDFIAGGGSKFFNKRKDGKDLLNELQQKGFYTATKSLGDISDLDAASKVAYLLADNGMAPAAEGRSDFLSNATDLAIEFLHKKSSNFFLMVEGSQIDWAGHKNDGAYLVSEIIDFDDAIGAALDFAEKDGNTLVIVTADHETGGFTLASKKSKTKIGMLFNDYNDIEMTFSTAGHSSTLVPVFAYGPGAEEFSGIYENNDIFKKIMKLENLSATK